MEVIYFTFSLMTTSKRISLLFTGYVTLLILAFGVIINASFFLSWYRIIDTRPIMKPTPVIEVTKMMSGTMIS